MALFYSALGRKAIVWPKILVDERRLTMRTGDSILGAAHPAKVWKERGWRSGAVLLFALRPVNLGRGLIEGLAAIPGLPARQEHPAIGEGCGGHSIALRAHRPHDRKSAPSRVVDLH